MTLRAILRWPDPRLQAPCAPVAPGEDVAALVTDMFETMYAAPGRGLAAPQVGVLKRVFVMDAGWKAGTPTPRACVNPTILWRSDTMAEVAEGCLSIPGLSLPVSRPVAVGLGWTDIEGQRHEALLEGFEATCAQHELDHLDGIVTLDRLSPDARAAALAGYAA